MRLRAFHLAPAALAIIVASSAAAQSLSEQAAAAGVVGVLAKKAAPSGLSAAKKARAVAGKADQRLDPFALPFAEAGAPGASKQRDPRILQSGAAPPQSAQAPQPAPWSWRLKGFVAADRNFVAVMEGPSGVVFAKVGQRLDADSRLLAIERSRVVVEVKGVKLRLSPW